MADAKVSALTAQSDALASGDLVPVVDVSDTTQGAGGSTKKATMTQIATYTDAQGLASHLADTTDAHDASAISNVAAGNIVATDVQAAINELDTEKLGTTAHDSVDHSTAMSTVILDDISDVTITAAAAGDLLRWNGSAWVDYPDSNYATSGHDHTGTYQPLDADLTDIAAISDAQGDIIVRGAAGWERLAAGTNGHFLKTQGAAANPTWAAAGNTPAGLAAVSTQSGKFFVGGLAGMTAGRVVTTEAMLLPVMFPTAVTIDRIGMTITASAATTVRLGIYNARSDGLPGTVLVDAGTIDVSTTGEKLITVSQALAAHTVYFLAFTAAAGGGTAWGITDHNSSADFGRSSGNQDSVHLRMYDSGNTPGSFRDMSAVTPVSVTTQFYASPYVRIA